MSHRFLPFRGAPSWSDGLAGDFQTNANAWAIIRPQGRRLCINDYTNLYAIYL